MNVMNTLKIIWNSNKRIYLFERVKAEWTIEKDNVNHTNDIEIGCTLFVVVVDRIWHYSTTFQKKKKIFAGYFFCSCCCCIESVFVLADKTRHTMFNVGHSKQHTNRIRQTPQKKTKTKREKLKMPQNCF